MKSNTLCRVLLVGKCNFDSRSASSGGWYSVRAAKCSLYTIPSWPTFYALTLSVLNNWKGLPEQGLWVPP